MDQLNLELILEETGQRYAVNYAEARENVDDNRIHAEKDFYHKDMMEILNEAGADLTFDEIFEVLEYYQEIFKNFILNQKIECLN